MYYSTINICYLEWSVDEKSTLFLFIKRRCEKIDKYKTEYKHDSASLYARQWALSRNRDYNDFRAVHNANQQAIYDEKTGPNLTEMNSDWDYWAWSKYVQH